MRLLFNITGRSVIPLRSDFARRPIREIPCSVILARELMSVSLRARMIR
jgi:hypothetical protein